MFLESELHYWRTRGHSVQELDHVFETAPDNLQLVRVVSGPNRRWQFEVKSVFEDRYLALITPFLSAVFEAFSPPEGKFLICMHDTAYPGMFGDAPGFAFSKLKTDTTTLLLPDPFYLGSSGYVHNFTLLDRSPVTWTEKHPVAFWRGSSTGAPLTPDAWQANLRVQLCTLAKELGDESFLDAKISNIVQTTDPSVDQALRDAGICTDWVDLQRFVYYRYLIDIDGNSNAWGLIEKMYMGGVILKVEGQWTQWFYPLLKPWEHFIPVAPDLSDLIEKIRWAKENDEECQRIVARAKELVRSLPFIVVLKEFGHVISELLASQRKD